MNGEPPLVAVVDRFDGGPGPATKGGPAVVGHGLGDLFWAVHDEGAHLKHRRSNRATSEKEELCRAAGVGQIGRLIVPKLDCLVGANRGAGDLYLFAGEEVEGSVDPGPGRRQGPGGVRGQANQPDSQVGVGL